METFDLQTKFAKSFMEATLYDDAAKFLKMSQTQLEGWDESNAKVAIRKLIAVKLEGVLALREGKWNKAEEKLNSALSIIDKVKFVAF